MEIGNDTSFLFSPFAANRRTKQSFLLGTRFVWYWLVGKWVDSFFGGGFHPPFPTWFLFLFYLTFFLFAVLFFFCQTGVFVVFSCFFSVPFLLLPTSLLLVCVCVSVAVFLCLVCVVRFIFVWITLCSFFFCVRGLLFLPPSPSPLLCC